MEKVATGWRSPRLGQYVNVRRWGFYGQPVLLFPTAGGDAEECERFLMLRVLAPLINHGRIKVYSVDSVAGRYWIDGESSGMVRAEMQNRFDSFITHELVPAIRHDSGDNDIVVSGASIGAFNALAVLCRHPDVFSTAICMSGTYDMSRWMDGQHTQAYHFASPLHFLPYLGEGPQLTRLRKRFILLATGEGRWEAPNESWQVAHVLGQKGIPNRVDSWGPAYDHDWTTWREMLPRYLDQLTR
ncbi:MAG: alpha/beta hydrolase-fold protein [Myxococcota bacterium]